MQGRMISLLETIEALYGNLGLDLAIKTFINADGTVDGELRIGNLPDSWRTEEGMLEMIASLSAVFSSFRPFDEDPPMGGKFWISFGVRFGPQNESEMEGLAELYKRFRGMFQTGTYPTQAWHLAAIMNSLVIENQGLRVIIDGIMRRHGLPPSVILVRFIWTPEKDAKGKPVRPGRYADELGNK